MLLTGVFSLHISLSVFPDFIIELLMGEINRQRNLSRSETVDNNICTFENKNWRESGKWIGMSVIPLKSWVFSLRVY